MLPHRIVAFGASSIHGVGDPEGGGFVGRLRAWHESQHEKNLVFNLGVPGDMTAGMLTRFIPEVKFRSPDLILFYFGLNDVRRMEFIPIQKAINSFLRSYRNSWSQCPFKSPALLETFRLLDCSSL